MSQHLSCVYSMITQSQLNFAVYCVSAVHQTTCCIIMTKLLRSMLLHVKVTFILNTKHLKTHAVSLSLLLFNKISQYRELICHFFPSCMCVSLYIYIVINTFKHSSGWVPTHICSSTNTYMHKFCSVMLCQIDISSVKNIRVSFTY